MANGILF
jgi:hypothetical protein